MCKGFKCQMHLFVIINAISGSLLIKDTFYHGLHQIVISLLDMQVLIGVLATSFSMHLLHCMWSSFLLLTQTHQTNSSTQDKLIRDTLLIKERFHSHDSETMLIH